MYESLYSLLHNDVKGVPCIFLLDSLTSSSFAKSFIMLGLRACSTDELEDGWLKKATPAGIGGHAIASSKPR